MNTSIYIARRYLFSKKSTHAINIISGISMLGVFIGSAALIIILSGFNGFEKVIIELFNNFSPQIKIEPVKGKTFNPNQPYFNELHKNAALFSFSEVLEEKALIAYGDRKTICIVKGVSTEFLNNTDLQKIIVAGKFKLNAHNQPSAVIGSIIQSTLSVNINDQFTALQVYSPKRNVVNSINPADEFVQQSIYPAGVFSIQQDFDNIVITPLSFTRALLEQPVEVSSLELNFKPGTDVDKMQQEIRQKAGPAFTIKNRREQNEALYRILNLEKGATFCILTFILIIAIFNIVGSLTMLVMDKRKDIAILSSLGAGRMLIQGIFFFEGMLISWIGCFGGIAVGLLFCLAQLQFGLIKMGSATSVLDAYPVDLQFSNVLLVFFTVTVISVIAAAISARVSVQGLDEIKQDL
ncbi:lipoprotein-releasing system permease protein [Mucilaginibacter gracilis]|uniref:Lipoprotein-releasing system permease protein n=1 Tax=Mucilaginibacter gracilis TaxID=423350 RepID=A0A495J040_9SPHI|nr:ABC transporter permease [Mucilaginibacter gracilis]RKR81664.1 lipoprotein-releasing system permease protein [Mucilaginibacter gracilis]